ncbi:hypothetical protein R4U18_000519 [Salmonella enterica]|nr:hypothetical protein [Salmonella enterica]
MTPDPARQRHQAQERWFYCVLMKKSSQSWMEWLRKKFASTYAAQEIGVKANSWSQNYKKHWQFMYNKCAELDQTSLEKLMRKI